MEGSEREGPQVTPLSASHLELVLLDELVEVHRDWEGLDWRRRGKGGGKGEGGEVEGREREGPQVTVKPGPLRALLRHCREVTWN